VRGALKAAATVAGVAAAAAVAFNAVRGDRMEIEFTPENPADSAAGGGVEMQADRSRRGGSLDDGGVQRGRGSRSSNGGDDGGDHAG
jgi:hypothetical protein